MGRRRTISDEDIADYVALIKMGWNCRMVGEKYGKDGNSVRFALRSRQIDVLKKYDKNLELKVISAYRSGLSSIQVGKKFGITPSTVLSYLKKYKIPKNKCILAEEYWQCYETGMSIAEIAAVYSCNASGVFLLLKRYGYKLRSIAEGARLHHSQKLIAEQKEANKS